MNPPSNSVLSHISIADTSETYLSQILFSIIPEAIYITVYLTSFIIFKVIITNTDRLKSGIYEAPQCKVVCASLSLDTSYVK